jgi:hypothetical protein
VRVWAVLGERASHGARRVSLLAGWSDVDGFLTGGTVSATQGIQLPGFSIGTLRTVMVANKKKSLASVFALFSSFVSKAAELLHSPPRCRTL